MEEDVQFGKDYLLLALRLNNHIEGYVDSYYGPAEFMTVVEQEGKKSPNTLLNNVKYLIRALPDQGFGDERNNYINKQLGAMKTLIDMLSGVEIAYLEKVRLLYDIQPKPGIDESSITKVISELDELFSGRGSLLERVEKFRKEQRIPKEKIERVFKNGLAIVRMRTKKLYNDLLPVNETIRIKIVENEPWSAYNWYLGNYQSRIDINTDLPQEWEFVLRLTSHEGYPGHHTELSIKEQLLYHQENRFEHAIYLIHAPTAVISEGLAEAGLNVIFPDERHLVGVKLAEIYPDTPDISTDMSIRFYELWEEVNSFLSNLAITVNVDDWTDEDIIKYIREVNLPLSEERIRKQLEFLRHPLYASYEPTYVYGKKLIKKKYGEKPSPEDFVQLLTKAILPSDLE